MKVIRETVVAGKTILRSLKVSTRIRTEERKRAPKMNPTSEAVWKVNNRNAIRDLTIKLNHNFGFGDWHLVLTYEVEPTPEQAKKDKKKFLRKLREYTAKHDMKFKRVDVTEYKHKRIHHHVVCSQIPFETIQNFWPHGKVRPTRLDESGNYYKLAEYLVKETSKTYREEGSVQRRRYNCSRNIAMPEKKKEIVSDRELRKDPKALKGYYIDQDTVRKYEHAITRADCMEYIMVSLEEEPRLKKWKRGKTVKYKERYKASVEEQLGLSELYCDGRKYLK